jgi:hypothetical protein
VAAVWARHCVERSRSMPPECGLRKIIP